MTSYTDGGEEDDGRDGRSPEVHTLYNRDARDREPGMLTYDDREYLLGQKNVSGGSEAQLRQRMRDRVRNALLDFELLLKAMEDRDIQTIFDNITEPPWPRESEISEVYHGSEYALAFLYYGITECTHANFERLLETETLEDAREYVDGGAAAAGDDGSDGEGATTVDELREMERERSETERER